MKLFLDSADIEYIREAISWGVVDGVTTNPSLIKKAVVSMQAGGADVSMESYIKKILATVGRMCPVSLEVAALDHESMVEEGIILYEKFNSVAGNVVIKIPVCTVNGRGEGDPFDGIRAISSLADEKIPVNATLIFTPEQAMLAAKAGADYVSPFAGRIDDRIRTAAGVPFDKTDHFPVQGLAKTDDGASYDDFGLMSGVDLIGSIADIFQEYEFSEECEIIAASIRNAQQVRDCAEVGSDIATVPFDVLKSMIMHPGTIDGIDGFTRDLVSEYTGLFTKDSPAQ